MGLDYAILRKMERGNTALEVEVRASIANFVARQSASERDFAHKLAETASFKSLLEAMAAPPEHWPRRASERIVYSEQ